MGDAAAIRRQRFENKVGQLKQREGMVQDFERMLSTETRVREEARALERVEQMRRNRNRAEIESELQQEAQLDALALKAKQREFSDQEAKICTELERRKREQIMEERVLHKIRTESTELRDLEMKLRPGMVTLTWTSMNIDSYKLHVQVFLSFNISDCSWSYCVLIVPTGIVLIVLIIPY